MSHQKTLPWYRQFWPWFLIALPTAVVVACLYTIWLALGSPLSLVKKDYYQEGLTINMNKAEVQRAQDLGLQMRVDFISTGQELQVRLDSRGVPYDAGPSLVLEFNHPLDASKDRSFTLDSIAPGEYQVAITTAEATVLQAESRWYVYLKGVLPDHSAWTLQSEWPVPSRG